MVALVSSTSHVVCDGHDYYALHGMLSLDAAPAALVVQRTPVPPAASRNGDLFAWFSSLGYRVRGVLSTLLDAPVTRVCVLREDWVAAEKARSAPDEDAPFTSTNDAVTSLLFRLCRTTVGAMSYNLRGRVDGLSDAHVGNYSDMVGYQAPDFCEPRRIRESLRALRRVRSGPYPGFWTSLRARFTMVTNWTSLHRSVRLRGCEQVLHLPLKDAAGFDFSACFVFRPREGQVGVLMISREPAGGGRLDTAALREAFRFLS